MQNTSKIRASAHAFGTILDGRTYGILGRVGFNGQERDDEISGVGNSNTAEFWQYDTRLGRRWNIDPINMPWLSSYSTFDNKPIYNTDVLGNTFEGSASKQNAASAKGDATQRKKDISTRQQELGGEIAAIDKALANNPTKKEERTLRKDLEIKTSEGKYLEKALAIADRTISEINEMEISTQKFTLLESNEVGDGGATVYDKATNTVAMFYNPQSKTAKKHELKHGYQFLEKKISFSPKVTRTIEGTIFQDAGILFDKTDEVEAYEVSYAFDPSKPKPIQGKLNFGDVGLEYVQRINDYFNLPNENINIDNYKTKIPLREQEGDINFNTVPK